jgi:hypothetical protein
MSDTSMGPGWWLASDGRWYPPHQAPGAPAPAFPAPTQWASAGATQTMIPQAPQYPQYPQAAQYHQAYQPPAGYALKKKKRRWPWVVLVVVVLLVIGGALSTPDDEGSTATSGGGSGAPEQPVVQDPAGGDTPAAADPSAGPLTLGGTDNTSGFDVTLLQYVDQWQSTNQFESPDPGMRYIAVELTMVNTTSEAKSFSTLLGLEVIDSLGQRWSPAFAGFDLPQLGGDVAPGTNIRGWQVFEVPADATGMRLTVKGSLTASGIVFQL